MESLEEFYQRISVALPQNINSDIGHFNIFKRGDHLNCSTLPYSRKDYFKITLLKGKNRIHYAQKTVQSDKYALMFSDPLVPYSWDSLDGKKDGYFCIFTESFFHYFGKVRDYPVFKPNQNKLFLLDEDSLIRCEKIFLEMEKEINSDYEYKDDLLRNLTLELIHLAMRMEPAKESYIEPKNKKNKISTLFNDLLERQFPINLPYERLELKNPNDYSRLLDIHTNHLNRILKETTSKTTSEIIASRILDEAKILLKHSSWKVNEISYSLGYEDSAHFINFFKKRVNYTPQKYRTLENV
ncbi:helix-turn-helix domain-containing protein [Halarcobacter ebronensis]|uniref:AraC family transcriptional regulator n=1 Tax=Halarcobacter ebronensis TaxID=1462615 RepID=A0A4Q1AHM1_9BACT|nr:AraC family transcriptional regulator [Halarcobacter ebronensis]QKF81179.1 transcriptional regulator, AraC family [Halarcobacter ebronensis]RXK03246.1 AraC family transcriptional regulator [Halarcobacter ebronensis]